MLALRGSSKCDSYLLVYIYIYLFIDFLLCGSMVIFLFSIILLKDRLKLKLDTNTIA